MSIENGCGVEDFTKPRCRFYTVTGSEDAYGDGVQRRIVMTPLEYVYGRGVWVKEGEGRLFRIPKRLWCGFPFADHVEARHAAREGGDANG